MGKLRAMLPLLLAVVIALAASVGIYRWMQHTKTRTPGVVEAPVVKEGVEIALAMGDLPWGTKLTREMIKFVTMSKDNLPPGTFHTMESLEGRVLVQPVKKNEMIIESRLAPENVTTGESPPLFLPESGRWPWPGTRSSALPASFSRGTSWMFSSRCG